MMRFSFGRVMAVLVKEFRQMMRGQPSVILSIPIIQLLLFGYAINDNPHHLPTGVYVQDQGEFARSILAAMRNTGYFDIVAIGAQHGRTRSADGAGQDHVQRDDTWRFHPPRGAARQCADPGRGGRLGSDRNRQRHRRAGRRCRRRRSTHDLIGPLAPEASSAPFTAVVHSRYNPEAITSYNIVPGLLGTVLSMTLVFMTAQSLAREREVGTLEGLLATPVRPVEVLIGKLAPYVGIGILQTGIILTLARALFDVPAAGGWDALAVGVVLFIIGSLALGFLISTLARTQQEAQLIAQFYFMPSFLLSGFFFPFAGMPDWAQVIGSLVPVTHFLRIVRGSLLKGQGMADAWPSLVALMLFVLGVSVLAMLRYRTTLD